MEEHKHKMKSHCSGMLWLGGWLFTVGYLHLAFLQGLLALILWPYYLGVHFSI